MAIARTVIHEGYRSRFTTATLLMNELLQAQGGHSLGRALKGWSRYDLIVVDEIGYVPFAPDGARLLFQSFLSSPNADRSW